MFKEVASGVDFPAMEREILSFWLETQAFEKLVAKNRGGARWSFIDGPITANGPMAVHHAWGRTYKDLFQRFKAMQGYDERYQNGFDCQGLWVEVLVEKELGFKSKRDIEAYGIANFVEACKERVRHFAAMQTQQSIRLGNWMHWDDSYFTMSDENNYTIWLFLKRCHERGLIYRGYDSMPWCPRCSTGISHHEIVTEGYQELTHTSVFLRFPLIDRPCESLLIWTTTPWTLAANVAAEVHPELTYLRVRQGSHVFYVSRGALANSVKGKHELLGEVLGSEMEGWRYRGPFDELPAVQAANAPEAHRVIAGKDVSDAEGTGIVHIAPGCGKEDFELGKSYSLPAIAPLDEFGNYLAGFDWLSGQNVEAVPDQIVRSLEQKGVLHRAEPYTHRYPVCWRCSTQLVFRLVDEWFISMDRPKSEEALERTAGRDEPPLREQIMEVVKKIKWLPSWGLERELDWLRNMDDWMISKKRYWGLALPIWRCAACDWFDVIGGDEELKERAVSGWNSFAGHTPHRPWIDEVKIACPQCGEPCSRVPEVGNPWLDAGIVPYATLDYRHNREHWAQWFPADFITESFPGQFRNWFYSLLTMSTVIQNREPFRTVLGYALLRDEQGREMHKSWGNAIDFNDAAERIGASVMRWMFAATSPENNLNFGYGLADEVKRRLLTLWNVYGFFCNYARLDGFDPATRSIPVSERPALDRWVLAELNALVGEVTRRYEAFDSMTATRRFESFVDDLSTWYVRRGRPRYWKSEADDDKAAAYLTLWEVLTTLAKLLAPSMPFLAESMYQNLVRGINPAAPESVHHTVWPVADPTVEDADLLAAMALTRQIVGLGRAARQKAKMKVRQPLAGLHVKLKSPQDREALQSLLDQVLDELNVKSVRFVDEATHLVSYRVKPNFKLLGPLFGPRVNAVARALQGVDAAALARHHAAGEPVTVVVEGLELSVPAEDYEVETAGAEGFTVVEESGYFVALDTRLSPELIQEGLARELIHRINGLRKDAGFRVEDRIAITHQTIGELAEVFQRFGDSIRVETLAVQLVAGSPEPGAHAESLEIDGHRVTIGVRRVEAPATSIA